MFDSSTEQLDEFQTPHTGETKIELEPINFTHAAARNHHALGRFVAERYAISDAFAPLAPHFEGVALTARGLPGAPTVASAMALVVGNTAIVDAPWADSEMFPDSAASIATDMLSLLLSMFRSSSMHRLP